MAEQLLKLLLLDCALLVRQLSLNSVAIESCGITTHCLKVLVGKRVLGDGSLLDGLNMGL